MDSNREGKVAFGPAPNRGRSLLRAMGEQFTHVGSALANKETFAFGSPGNRSIWRALAIAALTTGTSVLIRTDVLDPLGKNAIYVAFYPSVAIAALVGGLPAGALATIFAALEISLYVAPQTSAYHEWPSFVIFLMSCALTTGVTEAMHRARSRAFEAEEEARIGLALKESEEFVRGVLNSLPQAIAVLNREGSIVAVNKTWETFAEENSANPECVGAGVNYFDVCRTAAKSGDRYAREALNGLESLQAGACDDFTMEYPCISPDRTRWFVTHATRGRPGAELIVCHIDVTRLKDAEGALRDNEQLMRAVLGATADAIIAIDERGVMQSVNPAAVKLFGYDESELIGRNVNMLMPEPYHSEHAQYVSNYLRTGEAKIIGIGREAEAVRKDGSIFPVLLSVREAAREGPRLFVGVLHDITERKRIEKRQLDLMQELKNSEIEANARQALFRSIFEGAPEGIILTDSNRRIVMANAAIIRMFGYDIKELLRSPTAMLYAQPEDWDNIGQVAATGEPPQVPPEPHIIRCRRKSGEIFPGEIIKVPYRDADGKAIGSIGILRDVTWELRREEELREAQRLDALGQLTGGIAHDFNNLLTVISGNLQLLALKLQNGPLSRYLDEAERAIEMGARLNHRLMTFARQRRLEPVATNLNEQVSDMWQLLRRTIGENIAVSTNLADDLWMVLIDPSEVESAILNLAINARDAMPGGGKLLIETKNVVIAHEGEHGREELAPGKYVKLCVVDTGCGMSEEVAARAFEPFFTTKEPGKGTGLGLSSIYGFVKQSGGHITLESAIGHGAKVTIYLPKFEEGERTATDMKAATGPVSGAGETLLVVEDNADIRHLTVERLNALGYRVLEANNAFDALATIESKGPIDLIFTDVIMPGGVSGFELAQKIKERWPSQKILLTSGFAGEIGAEDITPGIALLRKPYNQIELAQSVDAALGRER